MGKQTRTQLKPCPFCGSKADIFSWVNPEGVTKYFVECINHRCHVSPYTPMYSNKGVAVRVWNKRYE